MDEYSTTSRVRFITLAIAFELSLGALGVLLGWLTGPWPWKTLLPLKQADLLVAIVAGTGTALILLTGIVLVDRKPFGFFRQLRWTVRRLIVPLFSETGTWGLFLISLSAGIGEEFLFRGYCQAALTTWWAPPWGTWCALLAASFLFGCCHWISLPYAVVATVMGLVLGILFLATGNLVASIVAHALYDFLALIYLTRPRSMSC